MVPEKNSLLSSSNDFSSLQLKKAFDRHLYISSSSVLCYDGVLCYLSNIVGHGSLNEVEQNLQRFFSSKQTDEAYEHLHQCLDYCLTIIDRNEDAHVCNLLQQCSNELTNASTLIKVMQNISSNQLFSYLPIFVTDDWLHMIRSVQNIEKLDMRLSSMINLQQQMSHLKDQMGSLDHLVRNFNQISLSIQSPIPSSNDQCCLRTYCTHSTIIHQSSLLSESPSSSWSSLDVDIHRINPLPGFIRNPVTNFIMPTGPTEPEVESSIISLDGNISSDDEPHVPVKHLTRSLSFQPQKNHTRPILVRRADVLWMYPAGLVKPKYNSLISSVDESADPGEFERVFKRTNSCDMDFPVKKPQTLPVDKILKKTKKVIKKSAKGSEDKTARYTSFFFSSPLRINWIRSFVVLFFI